MELRRVRVPVEHVWRNGFLYGTSLVYADLFIRRRIWLDLLIEKDFWLPQQVFPPLNYFIVLLFFLTFKEPSRKSRSGCWQLHINGYEIRNTLIITEISLHLNRARLLIRRIYCFPNPFASRLRRFRTPEVEGNAESRSRGFRNSSADVLGFNSNHRVGKITTQLWFRSLHLSTELFLLWRNVMWLLYWYVNSNHSQLAFYFNNARRHSPVGIFIISTFNSIKLGLFFFM